MKFLLRNQTSFVFQCTASSTRKHYFGMNVSWLFLRHNHEHQNTDIHHLHFMNPNASPSTLCACVRVSVPGAARLAPGLVSAP